MKYLVVILIIVLLFLILKNDISEKFNQELISPEVIEVVKKGNEAIVKFKSDSNKKRDFMIFYIDTVNPQSGIWVEKKVTCETELCEFTLNDLEGSRYHLVVVETDGKNMSKLDKIIKFGDGDPFTPYKIIPSVSNITFMENNTEPIIESRVANGAEVFEEEEEERESDSPTPYVECGRNPKVKFVETEQDMEGVEVRSKCNVDSEIPKIGKRVSRSLWNEFKKGHLTVDFNLVN